MQRADVQSMTAPLRVTAPWKNTRGQNGVHVCGHVHEVRAYSGRENHRNIHYKENQTTCILDIFDKIHLSWNPMTSRVER